MLNGRLVQDGEDYVRDEFRHSIGPKLSQPGDVLLTTKGTVGRVAIYPPVTEKVVYSPQLCYFRILDPTILSARYLSYWFKSEEFRHQASHRANNTDMAAYINLRDIGSLQLKCPPIAQQRAIAEVLGTLDDKITTNDRIGQLAGSLADAEFAKAATAWHFDATTFEEVAEIGGGGTPKTSVDEYWGGDVSWATPTDVTGLQSPYLSRTSRTITVDGLASCSSKLYPAGSILMTSRATIGAFALAQVPLAVNQGFIVVNAYNRVYQWWLFHEMRSRVDEFLSHANGATFLELPRGKFKKLGLRLPTVEQAFEFASRVRPLHDVAAQLMTETATLAAARDELLPLLMSGQVRLRDAEKIVGEVV
ncbi:restriction endonuclease subunit S [Micromonospora sp. AKA38]|uniref:restriction endonuclease subunit S n=1 Tax=Micromonospora sp. AKA38 TaxID=2733861 RepID=UPI0024931005|nr:restriction endonuclease subunit S [Micromonospora sp. AKA38]